MKIGIVTYHRPHNYGALFQAYALKLYLEANGHDAEFVDYWPEYHSRTYKTLYVLENKTLIDKIKTFLFICFGIFKVLKRRKGYQCFMEKYLGLSHTEKFKTAESLNRLKYDVVFYGSDQIWKKHSEPRFSGFNPVYFGAGDFAKKKVSYAASMGVIEVDAADKLCLKQLLRNFDSISVRERQLQDLVLEVTGKAVAQVWDPVFLCSKHRWNSFLPECRAVREKYILFYQLIPSDEAQALARELSQKSGAAVYEIRARVAPSKISSRYKYQTASPFEFLHLIRDADYVISSSFHGVAFSILFEKQFYALGMRNNSDRVRSMLSYLGIEQRYVAEKEELDWSDEIDYSEVKALLEKGVASSKEFINKHLL